MNKIVAYTLANDSTASWLEPFIKSFKRYNEKIKLMLIPYSNKNMENTKRICEKQSIEIVEDTDFFNTTDHFESLWMYSQTSSARYQKQKNRIGNFRKFYPLIKSNYDKSIFLDNDIIIVQKFDIKFFLKNYNFDILYFHETDTRYCYPDLFIKTYPNETERHHYNTGGFCCKKNAFSIEELKSFIIKIINENIDTLSSGRDQPIINMMSIYYKLNVGTNYSVHWPCGTRTISETDYMIHWAGDGCKKSFPMKEYYDQYC